MKNIILMLMVIAMAGCAGAPTYTRPIAPAMAKVLPGVRHRVEAGQTLWRISKIYDVDIDDILRANNIPEGATIEPGQLILIPNRLKQQNVPVRLSGDDFIWPLKGRVTAGFGVSYRNIMNKGLNIQGTSGEDILAARSGKVVFYADGFGNFGKTMIIDHGDGLRSVYARASDVFVRPGDNVQRGSVVGRVGSAGRDKNSYLHFEIRKGALPENPLFYLPR